MKEHAFRLLPGQDLKKTLMNYVDEHQIKSAVILCGVGSLSHINIRLAEAKDFYVAENHYEIVSITGTLSLDGVHIHISVSDSDGKVIGGHLVDDNIIYTTCEVVLGELEDYTFKRVEDETTGFKELEVSKI